MLGLALTASLVLARLGPATAAVTTVEHIYKAYGSSMYGGDIAACTSNTLLASEVARGST